jgi:hypothetical protein
MEIVVYTFAWQRLNLALEICLVAYISCEQLLMEVGNGMHYMYLL